MSDPKVIFSIDGPVKGRIVQLEQFEVHAAPGLIRWNTIEQLVAALRLKGKWSNGEQSGPISRIRIFVRSLAVLRGIDGAPIRDFSMTSPHIETGLMYSFEL